MNLKQVVAIVGVSSIAAASFAQYGRREGDRWDDRSWAAAHRWEIRQLDEIERGRGTVVVHSRDRADRFDKLQVRLFSDRTFKIKALDGSSVEVTGNWRNAGGDRITLDVDSVRRDRVNGSGTVELGRRGTFDRVEIVARDRYMDFRMSFVADDDFRGGVIGRPGGGYGSPRPQMDHFSMDRGHNGRGWFTYNGRRYRVDNVQVCVDRDGSYEVHFSGERNERIAGKYRRNGNFLQMDISRAFDDRSLAGSCKLDLSKYDEDWWRLTFAGRNGGNDFSFEFEVGR